MMGRRPWNPTRATFPSKMAKASSCPLWPRESLPVCPPGTCACCPPETCPGVVWLRGRLRPRFHPHLPRLEQRCPGVRKRMEHRGSWSSHHHHLLHRRRRPCPYWRALQPHVFSRQLAQWTSRRSPLPRPPPPPAAVFDPAEASCWPSSLTRCKRIQARLVIEIMASWLWIGDNLHRLV